MSKATEAAREAWAERQEQMVSERADEVQARRLAFVVRFGIHPDRWEGMAAIVGNIRLTGGKDGGEWWAERIPVGKWQEFWGVTDYYSDVFTLADIGRLIEEWGDR